MFSVRSTILINQQIRSNRQTRSTFNLNFTKLHKQKSRLRKTSFQFSSQADKLITFTWNFNHLVTQWCRRLQNDPEIVAAFVAKFRERKNFYLKMLKDAAVYESERTCALTVCRNRRQRNLKSKCVIFVIRCAICHENFSYLNENRLRLFGRKIQNLILCLAKLGRSLVMLLLLLLYAANCVFPECFQRNDDLVVGSVKLKP